MNILRYKQKAQGWMANELAGNDGGWSQSNYFNNSTPTTTQEQHDPSTGSWQFQPESGGESTWVPNATPATTPATDTTSAPDLSSMYGGSDAHLLNIAQGTSLGPNMTGDLQGAAPLSSMFARLGIIPGMSSDQFFNQESPAQQADRMGLVGNAIGAIGNTALNIFTPAAARIGLAGLGAYNTYNNTGNTQQALGQGLSALPGYAGAVGQGLQGNFGSAVSSLAGLNGVNGLGSRMAGMATDAASGKDVTPAAYSLAGLYAGNKLGGPIGGLLGNQIGNRFANLQGYK